MQTPCRRCGGTIGATGHGQCAACLLRLATLPEALAPDYEIETLLGSAPGSTTYLARETGSGRMLVVKIVTRPEGSGDPLAVARTVGANLIGFRHPAIACTHALDVDSDGHLRIVRDYMPGRALSAWMARGSSAERQQIFERVAEALSKAHARGLAHGHLDAANIIVTTGAQPVIVDFGAHAVRCALQEADTSAALMSDDDRRALEALRSLLADPP